MQPFAAPPTESTEREEADTVRRPLTLVGAALAAGLGIEIAVHPWFFNFARPGLGATVALAIACGSIATAAIRIGDQPIALPAVRLYAASVGFASLAMFRASPVLTFFNLATSVALLGSAVAAHHYTACRPATVTDFVRRGSDLAFSGSFGAVAVAAKDISELAVNGSPARIKERFTGLVIAIPVLIVFLLLFLSADAVFDDAVRRTLAMDLPQGVNQVIVLTIASAWILLGLMRRAIAGPQAPPPPSTRRIGPTEAITFIWLINSLFVTFVGFQIFEVVASYQTTDVNYAQQARSGFFELVAVAAMVVVVIMVMDWWTSSERADRVRLRRQQVGLILLTVAVLTSAVIRMALYVEAFGLTELRFYTSVFMAWIAFLLFWLGRTVLAGDRHRFARPAVGVLLGGLALLNVANPDSMIASYNMDHPAQSRIDESYMISALSADAVPAIMQRLELIGDACAQLDFVDRIRIPQSNDIRSWNLSRARATGLLEQAHTELYASCQSF